MERVKTGQLEIHAICTYIQLKDNIKVNELRQKISGIVKKYDSESKMTIDLQPLKAIHLHW
jgi:hypothetical protein